MTLCICQLFLLTRLNQSVVDSSGTLDHSPWTNSDFRPDWHGQVCVRANSSHLCHPSFHLSSVARLAIGIILERFHTLLLNHAPAACVMWWCAPSAFPSPRLARPAPLTSWDLIPSKIHAPTSLSQALLPGKLTLRQTFLLLLMYLWYFSSQPMYFISLYKGDWYCVSSYASTAV